MFNVVSFVVVLELYQHVCVYFGSFERLDGYGICQSADNGKYSNEINDLSMINDAYDLFHMHHAMESVLNIDFCGINESLVSENAG